MGDTENKKGKVVIVSGPSGVGKSTICQEIIKKLDNIYLSVSVTTRPKSDTEVDGKDYWFVSEQEFKERIEKNMLLEYAEVFGHMYGTPRDKVEQAVNEGKNVILEIDVQGAKKTQMVFPDAVMIFILPPTEKDLVKRLDNRGRDSADVTEQRLSGASDEIAAAWQYYKHMVINEDLQQAVDECIQIIKDAGNEP
jgi:guanylate kinase